MEDNEDIKIAKAIHYPVCWDTAAYPTLASALWEMVSFKASSDNIATCSTCKKSQGIKLV